MAQRPDWLNRITINPEQCGGRSCIRGMRIRVTDVLDLYAAGLSSGQILEEIGPSLPGGSSGCTIIWCA